MTASNEIDPLDPVRRFVEAFNANDVQGMQRACTESTSIIDDFAPHEWSGRHATTTWYRGMARMASGHGMSAWSITLGDPRRLILSEGNAYVAVPADVRWLQADAPAGRPCLIVMVLREEADGWRISSLAWAWN